jgi:hypothetical protein
MEYRGMNKRENTILIIGFVGGLGISTIFFSLVDNTIPAFLIPIEFVLTMLGMGYLAKSLDNE